MVSIKIEKLDEGAYLATSDALPGLVAEGRTIAETMEIAQDVARKIIESYIEHGDPLPTKTMLVKINRATIINHRGTELTETRNYLITNT